ncbi:hypothetical protein [Streptomyces sp. NPDC052496]|uniref:hypothetical protein n=1 Tax=Streptomyces sp. NPDC052496 TaxID=3154951 RepID=UPI00343363EB
MTAPVSEGARPSAWPTASRRNSARLVSGNNNPGCAAPSSPGLLSSPCEPHTRRWSDDPALGDPALMALLSNSTTTVGQE